MIPKRIAHPLLLGCLLAAVTVLTYWQVGNHGFLTYDDAEYVSENPFLRMGFSGTGITWAFTTFHAANWHPLTWLSHLCDVQLFGLDPRGHHLISLALHVANTLLVLFLLSRLTGALWRSAAVAALFGLHPLHVESVAWVAERKDLLCAFFFFLALHAYAAYVSSPGWWRYLLLLAACAASLMSKPMAVTLPFVLLLIDIWPLGRLRTENLRLFRSSLLRLMLEKVPLFLLSAASCAVTMVAQEGMGAVKSLAAYPFPMRLANALIAYGSYLLKTFWPHDLAVFYPFPRTVPWGHLLAALFLLVTVSGVAWQTRGRKPYILSGWLWYLGTLVPVIGLVQVGGQSAADRYTYIPLIGIFIMAVWWIGDLFAEHGQARAAAWGITIAALGACTAVTWKQLDYWRDDVALFSHALSVTSENYVAHNNLGYVLAARGKDIEAAGHFDEAIRIAPSFADAWLNRGDVFLRSGRFDEALSYLERAVTLRPGFAAAHNDRGVASMKMGRLEEARLSFAQAAALDPLMADAACNNGVVMGMLGKSEDAVRWYDRALQLNPDNPDYHLLLGGELLKLGRFAEAGHHLDEVIRLNPNSVAARQYRDRLSQAARTTK